MSGYIGCHYVINFIRIFVLYNAVKNKDFIPLNYKLINERRFGIHIKN